MVKTTMRWNGLALVAGALVLGGAIVMISLEPPGRFPTPLGSMLLLVAPVLLILALPSMCARQAEATGPDMPEGQSSLAQRGQRAGS
jgi:uncharacterized membrane protein YgdD (TMEM256/DUF423 family)